MATAQHLLANVLGHIELPASISHGDRDYHQAMAMQSALQIRQCYSEQARKEARSACVAHLIASLEPQQNLGRAI